MNVALVGNPNSGKTTLFNVLTGSKAYVGNWAGVTVERKEGKLIKTDKDIKIIDLPGIYSLSSYSDDEIVSCDYLLNEKPDFIINIVDATNMERNLYLTLQLIETGIPILIVLNMIDEVRRRGDFIDEEKLSELLGINVISISAAKEIGIEKVIWFLSNECDKVSNVESKLKHESFYSYVEKMINLLIDNNLPHEPLIAIKLLEKDKRFLEKFPDEKFLDMVNKISEEGLIHINSNSWDITIADARYRFIESILGRCIKRGDSADRTSLSDKIDKILLNKFLAIPSFLFIMMMIFQITFGVAGTFISDIIESFISNTLIPMMHEFLFSIGASQWIVSLIVNGIISGVGMILVFLPQIFILFLLLSLLEDSGYMARAAFIMDKPLRKFGLSGKAFVPMLMGFGCTVPAIMATRTLEDEKDRRLAIILTPFMSCSARMPVYAIITAAFFSKNQGLIVFSLYFLGIIVASISGVILKKVLFKNSVSTFIMEFPPYRLPTFKNLMLHTWDKVSGFVKKATSILLIASVVIWFLQTFNFKLQMVNNNFDSIFAAIGKVIAPIFKPLGFGDWKASVALLTGLVAKETIVSTLEILYGASAGFSMGLSEILQSVFSPLSAYCYLVFILLYIPCICALVTMKNEMHSWKWTIFTICFQMFIAWAVTFFIYQMGMLMGFN